MSIKHVHVLCFIFIFSAFFSSQSLAHSLKVFAYWEGNAVKGSVYFVGGAPAQSAVVHLETATGKRLQTLHTDQDGKFASEAFKDKLASEFLVYVTADSRDGHIANWQVENPYYSSSDNEAGKETSSARTLEHSDLILTARSSVVSISPSELERMVERAVSGQISAQIAPLREELHRYQSNARLSDILGGLGVIVGIAGAALWFSSRKKNFDK